MGRAARHRPDDFLDVALTLTRADGPAGVTMSAVARAAGAASGSLYHRFPDRPALLAALWLRTVRRFQEGFLASLSRDDALDAALGAAVHVVDWVREHPDQGRVLLAGARAFGRDTWPQEAGHAAAEIDTALGAALDGLRTRLDVPHERLLVAVVDLPYATVRRHLTEGRALPQDAGASVADAAAALLRPGAAPPPRR